jgi:hypothetical protein
VPELVAVVTPTTPATIPVSDDGIDSAFVGARRSFPYARYMRSVVSNAVSTCATVPVAGTYIRFAGSAPTENPWFRSHDVTCFTASAVGL